MKLRIRSLRYFYYLLSLLSPSQRAEIPLANWLREVVFASETGGRIAALAELVARGGPRVGRALYKLTLGRPKNWRERIPKVAGEVYDRETAISLSRHNLNQQVLEEFQHLLHEILFQPNLEPHGLNYQQIADLFHQLNMDFATQPFFVPEQLLQIMQNGGGYAADVTHEITGNMLNFNVIIAPSVGPNNELFMQNNVPVVELPPGTPTMHVTFSFNLEDLEQLVVNLRTLIESKLMSTIEGPASPPPGFFQGQGQPPPGAGGAGGIAAEASVATDYAQIHQEVLSQMLDKYYFSRVPNANGKDTIFVRSISRATAEAYMGYIHPFDAQGLARKIQASRLKDVSQVGISEAIPKTTSPFAGCKATTSDISEATALAHNGYIVGVYPSLVQFRVTEYYSLPTAGFFVLCLSVFAGVWFWLNRLTGKGGSLNQEWGCVDGTSDWGNNGVMIEQISEIDTYNFTFNKHRIRRAEFRPERRSDKTSTPFRNSLNSALLSELPPNGVRLNLVP